MYKIFLTVRNRLEITKKCIQALYKHSTMKFQLYCYDNLTNYRLDDHFIYFYNLYKHGLISQISFLTKESTFNAFSKAVAINQFGLNHNQDPEKDKYDFLLMIDNDIIMTPEFDKILLNSWKEVKKKKLDNIFVISQLPGGIKYTKDIVGGINGFEARQGKLGGGGIMCVQPNFFEEVGFLPISKLVGLNKKSDQIYWTLMDRKSKGLPYILGLKHKLGIHAATLAGGSVCNVLTKERNEKRALEKIKYEEGENLIKNMSFEEFFKHIQQEKYLRW